MIAVMEAEGITVEAGGRRLVDSASLVLFPGQLVAVVGPNGAGKSTLLRVLSGEWSPRGGRVAIAGRDIATLSPAELAVRRAVLSQSITVSFPFTLAEVVAMGAGDRGGPAVDALVTAALRAVDLVAFAGRTFSTLSGGEQQRGHFARVLVQMQGSLAGGGSAGVLMLDEPTASLDLRHQISLMMLARNVAAGGAAVLAILHDLNLAARFADRILVMANGRIRSEGSPAEVVTDAMLASVFGVRDAVGVVPPATPFVLPQGAEPVG